jgi:hypothetical protein
MDPLALAAVVGLVFAGKKLSENSSATTESPSRKAPPTLTRRDVALQANARDHAKDYFDLKIMTPDLGRRIGDWRIQPKQEVENFADITQGANRFPFGQPVYDLYGRENITNKMNNVPPIERMNVGPGLGVGPDVPATGGFQQFFRVLPNNINEERLTTLPGAEGPPNPVVKNGLTTMGEITHAAKPIKAWHRDPSQNRAQGQGGAITGSEGRPNQIKTERFTNRDETGLREDGLQFGTAQYNVYQPYAGGDGYTNKSIPRLTDNRSKPDRAGNGQRMNVRADPIGAIGAMTNLRPETTAFPVPHMNGGRFQNYRTPEFDKFNEKKGTKNPLSSPDTLDIAIRQLEKNALAQPPLSVA